MAVNGGASPNPQHARPIFALARYASLVPKDPDILVDLTTARTDFEAQVIVESLEAQGIPARAFTTAGTALPLDLGSTLPMRVAVRRKDLQRAAAALRAIRAESVDIDWDEVDVGESEADAGASRNGGPAGGGVLRTSVFPQVLYMLCGITLAAVICPAMLWVAGNYLGAPVQQLSIFGYFGLYSAVALLVWVIMALTIPRSKISAGNRPEPRS